MTSVDRLWIAYVFPTRVGVNRTPVRLSGRCTRIPHACGGEPRKGAWNAGKGGYSPRVWG